MASVSSADVTETSTPQATLRAPRGAEVLSAIEAAKAKEADKKIVLALLQAPELFTLADASSDEAANRGIPVSLLHAILRVFLSAFGLNWEKFLVGGILSKTIADAIKLRLAGGELPTARGKESQELHIAYCNHQCRNLLPNRIGSWLPCCHNAILHSGGF